MLRIVVQKDGQVVLDRSYDHPLVSIGRAPDNMIVLDAPQISARHLLVKRNTPATDFLLLDQSTNGTMVGGSSVGRLTFSTPIIASMPPFEVTFVPIVRSDTDSTPDAPPAPTVRAELSTPESVTPKGRGRDVELRALSSDGTQKTLVFSDSAIIGRTSDCDIQLRGRDVSRRHALVSRTGDRFQLRRLSDINGVSVNDRELRPNESTTLHDGDLVKIASHELLFFSPATRPPEAEAPDGRGGSPNFDLQVEARRTSDPSIAAFDLIGFLGEKTAPRVTPRIVPSFENVRRIIIDLGYLIGADEHGLHALAALVNEADRRGVAVQIIRIQPRVSDILSRSPLEKVLRRFVARSEESAIRRLRR